MFTDVLKKFFTGDAENENKEATLRTEKEASMFQQIKTAAARSNDTLVGDAIGCAALMIILVVGLYLPGLV
ncbi:hypothetical protein [Roseovarius pelagicus]|uniref:Uncharacterized protein n=1 Tax=Roseovarius pelagicus TaxID=2980108 RepID=A0ABY6DGE3_9RHOB|nr:hypothetical protein [Roseovarius pelagicus]UXX85229.1 hypothetical protein N7U68_03285 [Roseovarius pelagicus]